MYTNDKDQIRDLNRRINHLKIKEWNSRKGDKEIGKKKDKSHERRKRSNESFAILKDKSGIYENIMVASWAFIFC